MEQKVINSLLAFIDSPFQILEPINVISGQKKVFFASDGRSDDFVLKVNETFSATDLARMIKEIEFIQRLNCTGFSQIIEAEYYSNEWIHAYIDSLPFDLDDKSYIETLYPFFYSVEKRIEYINWDDTLTYLNCESRIIELMYKIFMLLNKVWKSRIIHRDLKPDNILIDHDYKPTIIDFGAAKSLREGTNALTNPFIGAPCTWGYAAPEQLVYDRNEMTFKVDQFALGIYFYQISMKIHPFGDITQIGLDNYFKLIKNRDIRKMNEFSELYSKEFCDFIIKLINFYPYERFRKPETILLKINEMRGR